jgi:hypothetical protein
MAKLHYIGPRLSTGEPERSLILDGIPAGDLDSDDLSPEQVKTALDSGLYAWATPDSKAAKEAEAAAKKAVTDPPPDDSAPAKESA